MAVPFSMAVQGEVLSAEEKKWRKITKPLEQKHGAIPDPTKYGMGNAGSSLTSNWCLWCTFTEDDKNPLEPHMLDHVNSGFTPPVPLNHLLKWLGQKEITGAGWVMVTIQTIKDIKK